MRQGTSPTHPAGSRAALNSAPESDGSLPNPTRLRHLRGGTNRNSGKAPAGKRPARSCLTLFRRMTDRNARKGRAMLPALFRALYPCLSCGKPLCRMPGQSVCRHLSFPRKTSFYRPLPCPQETSHTGLFHRKHLTPAFSTGNLSRPASAFAETYVLPEHPEIPSINTPVRRRPDRRRPPQAGAAAHACTERAPRCGTAERTVHAPRPTSEAMRKTDGKTLPCKS